MNFQPPDGPTTEDLAELANTLPATPEHAYAEGRADQLHDTLKWAVECWYLEVANRPLVNTHRRTLDDAWRQVIRHAGGEPDALIGPAHDALLAARGLAVGAA